jgi:cell division protein FtsA
MPVRLGFPIGVKGIVQLVQGPQYATGVGLVRYGAQALADARARGSVSEDGPLDVDDTSEVRERAAGFWGWLKAAF